MSSDFQMTPMCSGCGAEDLYGSNSLCLGCGIAGLIMGLDISKDDTWSTSKTNDTFAMDTSSPSPVIVPITKDEVRAVLLSRTNLTCADLASMFKPRIRSREDREAFTALLKKNCVLNVSNGNKYVVLREDTRYNGSIREAEIRAVFMTRTNVTVRDLVAVFKSRLRSRESKDAFTATLKKICRINKMNGINYVCLKDTKRRR